MKGWPGEPDMDYDVLVETAKLPRTPANQSPT